ncbi:hypothetical protein [Microbacterium sp.]
MSRRGSALAKGRIRLGTHVWWDAVTSGAFFGPASIVLSFLMAVTGLAPHQHYEQVGYVGAFAVAILGWAVLVVALIPAAVAERRLTRRRSRAVVVLTAVVVAASARPFIHEILFVLIFDIPLILDGWHVRVLSNLVVWVIGLSIVAMTARSIDVTRGTRGRLSHAVSILGQGRSRLARFENDNRALLDEIVGELRIRRDGMLAGDVDFDAVRNYSEVVRAASHRLEDRAHHNLNLITVEQPAPPFERRSGSLLSQLRPPPYLITGLVFAAATVPYTHHLGGIPLALLCLATVLTVTLAVDAITRAVSRGKDPRARGAIIVVAWAAAGVLLTACARWLLPTDDPALLGPIVSLPLVGVALAACTDAIASAAISSRRLEAVLVLVARTLTLKTAQARRPLRHAAHVLHGRVQGRCVMLAAYADEGTLTDEQVDSFRHELDEAFESVLWYEAEAEAVLRTDTVQSSHEDVEELVSTWSGLLEVSSDITPEAAEALHAPAISRRVATVVNEGFVNAVKHSEARRVWLAIAVEGPDLLVRTWSKGTLERSPSKSASRTISGIGDRGRIFQRADEVVLEVSVPLSTGHTAPVRIEHLSARRMRSGARVG